MTLILRMNPLVRLAVFGLLVLLLLQVFFIVRRDRHGLDLWLSRDQQGWWYLHRGDYFTAARRFENGHWKAYAYYRAQDFVRAEAWFAKAYDQQAFFNRANALAHQERYDEASDYYHIALALDEGMTAAKENLRLMRALGKQADQVEDFSSHSEGGLSADDVVFDLEKDENRQSEAERVSSEQYELDGQGKALWLKSLNTEAGDFLRLKFYYQHQHEDGAGD